MIKARKIVELPGKGYCQDSPAFRLERIKEATKTPGLSTPQALANAAHVDVDEVHELTKEGAVFKSGTGFGFRS